jgi:hypothetical protein
MKFINSLVSWFIKKRLHQIDLFIRYPIEVQHELFNKLIEYGKQTEWGNTFGYKKIKSISDFQKYVPISRYDDIKHYIDRIKKGEKKVLWPTEIKWFAKSSGTTSDKSKYIPISNESLEDCHYKAGKDMLAIYCNNYPETKIFTSKGIAMGGSQSINEIEGSDYYAGDLSAILMKNLPFWAELLRTPEISIALMDEWEEKILQIASATKNDNIVHLSGVPSWSILLLEQVLSISKKQYINEVWTDFEVYFHGGVNFTPYKDRFFEMFSDKKPRLMEIYNASEGFLALEDQAGTNELLLMLDYGIFYEFIPLDELENEHPQALLLNEVQLGTQYAIVISTNGGLWRYLIGDTVIFTSLYPFRIKITGRTKSFINIAGEELMVENAERAISEACSKTHAIIDEFTVGPIYSNGITKSKHQWLIEFKTLPNDITFFTEILDNALKHLNSDYEAKRYKNMILDTPDVITVPNGTFYKWLKQNGKLGGQHKVPRLSNNNTLITQIQSIIENQTTLH